MRALERSQRQHARAAYVPSLAHQTLPAPSLLTRTEPEWMQVLEQAMFQLTAQAEAMKVDIDSIRNSVNEHMQSTERRLMRIEKKLLAPS